MTEDTIKSTIVFADMVESLSNAQLGLLLDRIISSQPRLLIVGETGTGKSSLVRYLYEKAVERGKIGKPGGLVVMNMAAVPTELAESTLFGHAQGAFTSAHAERKGAFEEARGGVLFLDEIHHAPPTVQRKLLLAIGDREFSRLGESDKQKRKFDGWVIAGTTQPAKIEPELRYRLGDFILALKALRRRKRAFGRIVRALLHRITEERWPARMKGKSIALESKAGLEWLASQYWPGNIRELESVLRTASFFVAKPTAGISLSQLQAAYRLRALSFTAMGHPADSPPTTRPTDLDEGLSELLAERRDNPPTLAVWKAYLARAYLKEFPSKAAAARALEVDTKTFNKLLGYIGE